PHVCGSAVRWHSTYRRCETSAPRVLPRLPPRGDARPPAGTREIWVNEGGAASAVPRAVRCAAWVCNTAAACRRDDDAPHASAGALAGQTAPCKGAPTLIHL